MLKQWQLKQLNSMVYVKVMAAQATQFNVLITSNELEWCKKIVELIKTHVEYYKE
jgi:hypothetical protein